MAFLGEGVGVIESPLKPSHDPFRSNGFIQVIGKLAGPTTVRFDQLDHQGQWLHATVVSQVGSPTVQIDDPIGELPIQLDNPVFLIKINGIRLTLLFAYPALFSIQLSAVIGIDGMRGRYPLGKIAVYGLTIG